MRSIILRPGCLVKGGGDTGVCGAAVLLVSNGMIRTAKQLPEVSKTAVWGRAALHYSSVKEFDWLDMYCFPKNQ